MRSEDHTVDVTTNAPRIADSVSGMTCGATLQQAVEMGAHDQWEQDTSWTIDVITTTIPSILMHWDDLTGDRLDTQAARTAGDLEIQYLRKRQVYEKVSTEQARQSGYQILGVRRVDMKKADGTH